MKRCYKCGEYRMDHMFSADKYRSDGLNGKCKDCDSYARMVRYYRKRGMEIPKAIHAKLHIKVRGNDEEIRKRMITRAKKVKETKTIDGFYKYEPKYTITQKFFKWLKKTFDIIDNTL